jgi:hypothetical protein
LIPISPGTTVEKPVLLLLTIGDDATGILSATVDADVALVEPLPAIFSATALAVVFLERDSDGLGI